MSTPQRSRIERLVKALGDAGASELMLGSNSATRLVSQLTTPYYVYSADVVLEQVERVRQALGAGTDLYFSLKANPSLGLGQVIAREGVGAEVASIGELLLAQRAGFPAARTIFAGPGKTDEELELAAGLGILAVNVESQGELERLARIATALGRPVRAAIRVNPAEQVKGARMRMGGGPQQFGVDEEQLSVVAERFKGHPHVEIIGLHVYPGTQVFDAEALLGHCRHVVELGAGLAERLERPLEMIDFGGGFGVPYFQDSPEFDLPAFALGYRQVVRQCKSDPRLAPAKLIVELGRYLVAEAGVYVTRVVDVKHSRGKTFVVTDGGMNHHIMATGNFGQVFRKAYPMALLNSLDAPAPQKVTIAGPCCTPLDVFAQDIPFPSVKPGDLIGVFLSGAYGYSASSLAFLSHPTPAEVLVWQGKVYLLRGPGNPDQVLAGQFSVELE